MTGAFSFKELMQLELELELRSCGNADHCKQAHSSRPRRKVPCTRAVCLSGLSTLASARAAAEKKVLARRWRRRV